MGCLYPDRIFLGWAPARRSTTIATGYRATGRVKERYARLRESVKLMRGAVLGDR